MSEGTIDSGTLHVTCWKHKYMGGEDGCVRGGWRPSLGLICETVNSVGRGNFMFVSKKSGNFRNLWLWRPWMFEIDGSFRCSFHVHMKYAVCWYNCECAKMWRYRVYLLLPVVHVSKFAVRTLFCPFSRSLSRPLKHSWFVIFIPGMVWTLGLWCSSLLLVLACGLFNVSYSLCSYSTSSASVVTVPVTRFKMFKTVVRNNWETKTAWSFYPFSGTLASLSLFVFIGSCGT